MTQISNIVSEVSILILFCLNLIFSCVHQENQVDIIAKFFIFTCVGSLGLQSLISLVGFIGFIKKKFVMKVEITKETEARD